MIHDGAVEGRRDRSSSCSFTWSTMLQYETIGEPGSSISQAIATVVHHYGKEKDRAVHHTNLYVLHNERAKQESMLTTSLETLPYNLVQHSESTTNTSNPHSPNELISANRYRASRSPIDIKNNQDNRADTITTSTSDPH